jgi:hypothetical protein
MSDSDSQSSANSSATENDDNYDLSFHYGKEKGTTNNDKVNGKEKDNDNDALVTQPTIVAIAYGGKFCISFVSLFTTRQIRPNLSSLYVFSF